MAPHRRCFSAGCPTAFESTDLCPRIGCVAVKPQPPNAGTSGRLTPYFFGAADKSQYDREQTALAVDRAKSALYADAVRKLETATAEINVLKMKLATAAVRERREIMLALVARHDADGALTLTQTREIILAREGK